MDSKKRNNLHDAQQYFNYDLTKDRYAKTNIVEYFKNFDYGLNFGLGKISLLDIPLDKFGDGFDDGMKRAQRILKNQIDLYNMGREAYFSGNGIENYMDKESFMAGYNDAKMLSMSDEKTEDVSHHRH